MPDGPNSSYEDRAFGGAGLDVLIGNTGGDRLIDWVGEFNSYIVPFAPFGIATVSRQVEPQLPEFLYALSFSQGADPTRHTDTGNLTPCVNDIGKAVACGTAGSQSLRNGEPDGELGLVTQKDHGLWQEQTGGPTDPQAGQHARAARATCSARADFNNGPLQGFAVDSGVWAVASGQLQVAAASLGKDARPSSTSTSTCRSSTRSTARISTQKPTAGWKANSFVLFDYWSPTDFKFAGIDLSTNKMVIGHRTADGWFYDSQSPYNGSLKPDTFYDVLIDVNGTYVQVSVDDSQWFSYTFAARVLTDGSSVALNKGLVGFGSNNSRGVLDNIAVQSVPPGNTLDTTEYFEDGTRRALHRHSAAAPPGP